MPGIRVLARVAAFTLAPISTGLAVALSGTSVGGSGRGGFQPDFRAGVEMVRVSVSVQHEGRARPLPAFGPSDFIVQEDGVPQAVHDVSHEPQRLSLCIALDTSGSMVGRRRELAAEAVRTVFSVLEAEDELALVVFARNAMVPLRWTSPAAVPGLDWAQWTMPDDTAIYDGVRTALHLIDTANHPQRVVLVVSDGEERASTLPIESLVTTRRQSEAQVFGFLADPPPESRGRFPRDLAEHLLRRPPPQDLGAIVGDSGGVVYSIADSERLAAATLALISDLRGQLTISYQPGRPMDGTYRRLRIRTVRDDLRVRHRGGYLALPAVGGQR
jgi:VWFA-related protein